MVLEGSFNIESRQQLILKEKEFGITELRRRPSQVWHYIDTLGHIAIITRRKVRALAIMSVETYIATAPDPETAERELQSALEAYGREMK